MNSCFLHTCESFSNPELTQNYKKKEIIIYVFDSRAQLFKMEEDGCSFACSLFTCVFMSREMGQVQLIVDGRLSQGEKTRGGKVSSEDVLRSVIKVFHSK